MIKETLLSILRDKRTDTKNFRNAAQQLGSILAYEGSNFLKYISKNISTPFAETQGIELEQKPVLIVILRGGLALIDPFLKYFSNAPVGFIGLKRDEETAKAELYYFNVPKLKPNQYAFILDPTIATGGSASSAISLLKGNGYSENQIIFVSILAAKQGHDILQNSFPSIKIISVHKDPELNDKKFIIPGFGDFGDRFFGTV